MNAVDPSDMPTAICGEDAHDTFWTHILATSMQDSVVDIPDGDSLADCEQVECVKPSAQARRDMIVLLITLSLLVSLMLLLSGRRAETLSPQDAASPVGSGRFCVSESQEAGQ